MATSPLFVFNTIRNEYQLTVSFAQRQTAIEWLRSIGAKFFTSSDRVTRTTVIRFPKNGIEQRWALALLKKHGRKDANAPKTAATSPRVRKAWVAPVAPVFTAEVIASPWESTEAINPVRFMQDAGFHYQLCLPAGSSIHTASVLPEPAMPQAVTEMVGDAPLYLSPAFATKAQLLGCSKSKLYKLAQRFDVKGRSKMDASQLAEALLGLVKKSDISK